ncbi:MAG: hypothetical protein A2W52_03260 [Candidatus Taylorbacteria bacterium RIFCSPHIGHO2_02_49_25]|uniref:DUF192 domain-containing protein n=1 Tax=Candidatus Taylorbacteria bacterium RIFCSPHIGHO2_02_49_25 TaxID=1802305 RepID=A0A1G2MDT6_9BACT|nr:MAG: hypothetical protein UY62_C0022G0010 [Parcubacteria group bacterium GW2011_GWF2_50_9]OHA20753.1 MAG: hypothetical protein A2759_02045 [Candidatus Taylorbacteria bacterium RIFCSPHIGHO2_01_FULL_49_60]OHA21894.1 MAG: hypothetical protein A2W52_03260 [Candidatus Taylorbacteria bacterium RIFCSPHIGHO2_02_49_25]OHA35371.1 MAG: hypothetical protein A2W65_04760 [Candidatus Taylorbacteria bacterium RIFCSPLOWO2_02_50_13]OHA42031.1 MAG: hypothetical protein A3H73_01765 [Candidatus Taylorbacteria ba
MKRIILIGSSALPVLLVLFAAVKWAEAPVAPLSGAVAPAQSMAARSGATLEINGHTISAELADTAEERALGLGKRKFLAEDEGMLFVFERSDTYGIWMKDMRFSIDIVWLSPAQTNANCAPHSAEAYGCLVVVDVKEDARPESYPEAFFSREKASYVLEINGGLARKTGIRIGSFLTLGK